MEISITVGENSGYPFTFSSCSEGVRLTIKGKYNPDLPWIIRPAEAGEMIQALQILLGR
jgi:hypothetical protein